MRRLSLLMVLVAAPLLAQTPPPVPPTPPTAPFVTLPIGILAEPGEWIAVVPEKKDGGEVKWRIGSGLQIVPIDKLFPGQKAAGPVVKGRPGTYLVEAWVAKGDVASEIATCVIQIGIPEPPAPPVPPVPPVPPGPTPTANPFGNVPGLRVLITYETADKAKLPAGQYAILFGRPMRDYLEANCVARSTDGWKEYRIYDKDIPLTGESQVWQDVTHKRPADAVLWMAVGNGASGWSGPLPADVDAAKKIIDQFTK